MVVNKNSASIKKMYINSKLNQFDEIADRYDAEIVENLGYFGKYRQSMLSYKAQYLKYLLPCEPKGILDYGCSVGLNIPYLHQYFPNTKLYGCDISNESIRLARSKIRYCTFDTIGTVDEMVMRYEKKIDCVFVSAVLHHIPHPEHKKWRRCGQK